MRIIIPDLPGTVKKLLPLESSFAGRTQTIGQWVNEHRCKMRDNMGMVNAERHEHDIKILSIFLCDLLVRGIRGEGGQKILKGLQDTIQEKQDLVPKNYRQVLKKAKYRWGVHVGCSVMSGVVKYFRDDMKWNWKLYFDRVERGKEKNFRDDILLKIHNVGPKVRDLALSNFNPNYAAFDLHVVRVIARIGLLAYGWDVTGDRSVEFGTNPSDNDNYLFLHKLFLHMSDLCGGGFTPVDLDRVFWHLGRCKCKAITNCATCPIRVACLTGNKRGSNNEVGPIH